VLDALVDFIRQRIAHFLGDMADEADRAADDGDAAADAPGKTQLREDRADRPGGVDRQRTVQLALGGAQIASSSAT
jgi:hypothetical protein